MSDVTITVRGEHEAHLPPERATIRVTVRAEGPQRTTVVDHVMRLAEPVRTSIGGRVEAGSALDWNSTRLSVRAERPWNTDGKRLAPVYYASIDVTATFAEASELSVWITDISAWDGVEIGGVDWHLTPDTRLRVERDVATRAIGVAAARAEAYATALGLTAVTPVEIADTGLLSSVASAPGAPFGKARGAVAFAADAAPAMEYEPQDIILTATVEARFLAR